MGNLAGLKHRVDKTYDHSIGISEGQIYSRSPATCLVRLKRETRSSLNCKKKKNLSEKAADNISLTVVTRNAKIQNK